jgi:tRNA (guanine-N7-)-methyltransferase
MHSAQPRRRPVRSYVRREGRMTAAQERALQELWPRYGIELENNSIDPRSLFGREAPLMLEIGFGNGDALIQMAAAHPENDYIGMEVHRPGVGSLMLRLEQDGIENVRVIATDASEALPCFPDGSLDAAYLFFPDPWPKKRHHKRRLVQPRFVEVLTRKLKPGAVFHLATDWHDYAEQMLAVLEQQAQLENLAGRGCYAPRLVERPRTRFERRGLRLGHGVWDLAFRRRAV